MSYPTPESEERIVTLDWIKENAKYYVTDNIEKKTHAICWIFGKEKHSGYIFYERRDGWEFDPFKMGVGVVDWYLDKTNRYDITSDFETAKSNSTWD